MALQGFLNGLVMAGKGGERGKLGSPFNDRHRRPFVGNGALQIDDVSVVGNIFFRHCISLLSDIPKSQALWPPIWALRWMVVAHSCRLAPFKRAFLP